MSHLAPFAGIVPSISSLLQDVTLFTPFTGLNGLPAIVLGTSIKVLPCPLQLLYHVCISGFDYCAWCPPRYLFGLRLVLPFEYLHRLHHDSMIGLALVYPPFLHGPWHMSPHAQGRTLRFASFYIGFDLTFAFISDSASFFWICLGLSFAFISGFTSFFCLDLGIPFAFMSGFAPCSALVLVSLLTPFRFLPFSSAFVLVPFSAVVSVNGLILDV